MDIRLKNLMDNISSMDPIEAMKTLNRMNLAVARSEVNIVDSNGNDVSKIDLSKVYKVVQLRKLPRSYMYGGLFLEYPNGGGLVIQADKVYFLNKKNKLHEACNNSSTCDYYYINITNGQDVFGFKRVQLPGHLVIAVAMGLYDGKSYDEILGLVVNHMDLNKSNNFPDNLELCTKAQNSKHAIVLNALKKLNPDITSISAIKAEAVYDYIVSGAFNLALGLVE